MRSDHPGSSRPVLPTSQGRPHTLLLAIWFGLATGLAEVMPLAVKRFGQGRPIRFGPEIAWLAPGADLLAFVLIAVLVVVAQRVGKRFFALESSAFAVAVFAFFSVLSLLLMYYPLQLYTKVLLAAGVGVQLGRMAGRWPAGLARVVRVSLPWMSLLVVFAFLTVTARTSAVLNRDESAPQPAAGLPNVLLVVLDTVRAQNMGLYGYARPTTPNLDRWASTGVVFEGATATSPWTLPSHASMFTGRWPHEMSARLDRPLDGSYPTLAEVLRASGYATAGFVANTHYCGYEFGLSRGFARYEDYTVSLRELLIASILVRSVINNGVVRRTLGYYDNIPRRNAEAITNAFLDWLPQVGQRPFFVFLNYFDAHESYFPPPVFANAFGPEAPRGSEHLKQDIRRGYRLDWHTRPATEIKAEEDMYDGAIAYLDAELGRLFEELRIRGLLDTTFVIVTSDHGEQFGEHGLFLHGNSLYASLLRVPLVMWYPKGVPGGRRIASRVSLRDIPATVIDVTGVDAKPLFPGASLAQYWSGPAVSPSTDRLVLSEMHRADWGKDWYPTYRGDMASLMTDGYHYIRNGDGQEELYELNKDPFEERDLSQDPQQRTVLERLRLQLETITNISRR